MDICLKQDGDRVCLDLGDDGRRQVLWSIEIALVAAKSLDDYAGRAALSAQPGFHEREPSVAVDAIVNRGKALVRLRFGWWANRLSFTPQHAVNLATWLRLAGRKAEEMLAWDEERDPGILLR